MWDDEIAVKKFGELVKENKIKSVFETGTWKGQGTTWLLEYVDEVYTIEIDQVFYMEAQKNWKEEGWKETHKERAENISYTVFEKDNKKIHHFFGDSPEVMDIILTDKKEIVSRPCLFYLDAHWDWNQPQLMVYWPILKELQVLAKHKMSDSSIIIHDVKHPTKDFGYDELFSQPLDIDYLKEDILKINSKYNIYHNDEVGNPKNGRGILYITP